MYCVIDYFNLLCRTPGKQARMPVGKESEEYNMSHPRRGKAVVFNHDTFNIDGINPRSGSDVDVKNLVQTYDFLGFETIVHHNLTFSEIKTKINECKLKPSLSPFCFTMFRSSSLNKHVFCCSK